MHAVHMVAYTSVSIEATLTMMGKALETLSNNVHSCYTKTNFAERSFR